jgi:hypothetical protein
MERVMPEKGLAVTVKVRREDGRVEHVRVGTAYRAGAAFRIRFGEMLIGEAGVVQGLPVEAEPEEPKPQPMRWNDLATIPSAPAAPSTPAGPPGIRGLEFCAERARRNLANPAKARWHDDERALLEEIETELARQRGLTSRAESRHEQRGAA